MFNIHIYAFIMLIFNFFDNILAFYFLMTLRDQIYSDERNRVERDRMG